MKKRFMKIRQRWRKGGKFIRIEERRRRRRFRGRGDEKKRVNEKQNLKKRKRVYDGKREGEEEGKRKVGGGTNG